MLVFEFKKLIMQKITIFISVLLIIILLFVNFPLDTHSTQPSFTYLNIYISLINDYDAEMEMYYTAFEQNGEEFFQEQIELREYLVTLSFEEVLELETANIPENTTDFENSKKVNYATYIKSNHITINDLIKSVNSNYSFNSIRYSLGTDSIINCLYYSSFFIIPIFAIIISYLSFHLDDQLLYQQPKSRFKITLSKIVASISFSMITIFIGCIFVYLFYGFRNGFGNFKFPIALSLTEKFSRSSYPTFIYISYAKFIALSLFIIFLYILFINLFVYGLKVILKNKILPLLLSLVIVVGYYYLVFQKFSFWDSNYLIPFTYSNPIFSLFGKAVIYTDAKSAFNNIDTITESYQLILGKQLQWKYQFNTDVNYLNAIKVLTSSNIILLITNFILNRKAEIRR